MNDNIPAFPIVIDFGEGITQYKSMTARDYFAARAMQGLLADRKGYSTNDLIAKYAYEIADAMLKAREVK